MSHGLSTLPLAASLLLYVELLAQLRRVEDRSLPWWFGYARDGANLTGALLLWGAYALLGFPAATAMLAATLTTLVTYALDYVAARFVGRQRTRQALALPLLAWIAVMYVSPAPLLRAIAELIARASPRP